MTTTSTESPRLRDRAVSAAGTARDLTAAASGAALSAVAPAATKAKDTAQAYPRATVATLLVLGTGAVLITRRRRRAKRSR